MIFRPCRRAVIALFLFFAIAAATAFFLYHFICAIVLITIGVILTAEVLAVSYKFNADNVVINSGIFYKNQKFIPFKAVRSVSTSTEPFGALCGYKILSLSGPHRTLRLYWLCLQDADIIYTAVTEGIK